MEKLKIDFVVTWVDGSDPEWQKKKNNYKTLDFSDGMNNEEERYREWELFKYWFRAVERYAPWVNKIFLITEGHLPDWIDTNNEKLMIVKHEDFIDPKYLPTFNSNVIELNLHKITSLSRHFVLFNDDIFLNQDVAKIDFFENNLPKDTGIFSPIVPKRNTISSIVLNNLEILNDYFDFRNVVKHNPRKFYRLGYGKHLLKNFTVLPWKNILGFYDSHICVSYDKEIFKEVYDKEQKEFEKTYSHRFRTKEDINHWLVRYWQLCTGNFVPRNVNFGFYYNIDDSVKEIAKVIKDSRYKVICLNDSSHITNFDETKKKLLNVFENKYIKKSSYEK